MGLSHKPVHLAAIIRNVYHGIGLADGILPGSGSGRIVMDKKNLFFPFFMLLRSAYSHRLVYY
jgi:hypothetical protein